MKTLKRILYLIGYAFTGRWLMVMFCAAVLAGWKYIDLHADDGDNLDGIVLSNNKYYPIRKLSLWDFQKRGKGHK